MSTVFDSEAEPVTVFPSRKGPVRFVNARLQCTMAARIAPLPRALVNWRNFLIMSML
jgi:hypothetical protein